MNTSTQNTIAIIGKGNMGRPLAVLAEKAGYHVAIASTGPTKSVIKAIESAHIVIFAVPYAAALEIAGQTDAKVALHGKILIDICNPLTTDYMGLTVGYTTSAGEEIAKLLPGTTIVKAFNTVFADLLALRADGKSVNATVMVASDAPQATNTVLSLAGAFGLEGVDAGPLSNARYLEPITEQLIQLAYGKGLGTKIGFVLTQQG